MSGWGRRRVYGYAHCSAREQAVGPSASAFLGGHAGTPAQSLDLRIGSRHAGGSCLPPSAGTLWEPRGPGGRGPGGAQRTGRGRGPGRVFQTGACGVLLGRRPARGPRSMKPRRRAMFSQRSGTNSTGSAAPLPPPPARTAGHALAPPPHPPFLSWPKQCSADGMRQRLPQVAFRPCWAGRSMKLAGTRQGARLSRGRALLGGLAFPQAEGPPLGAAPPRPAAQRRPLPPGSRPNSSSGQNQHPVSLTEGSAVWRIFPCFI